MTLWNHIFKVFLILFSFQFFSCCLTSCNNYCAVVFIPITFTQRVYIPVTIDTFMLAVIALQLTCNKTSLARCPDPHGTTRSIDSFHLIAWPPPPPWSSTPASQPACTRHNPYLCSHPRTLSVEQITSSPHVTPQSPTRHGILICCGSISGSTWIGDSLCPKPILF